MGNRAKRAEISRLLRGTGLGRLYRGNKKVAWCMLNEHWLKSLLFKLRFKKGDLVNDCDGMNHILRSWLPGRRSSENWIGHDTGEGDNYEWVGHPGTSVIALDQFEIADNHWSCGCPYSPDPPETREEIEKHTLAYLIDPDVIAGGWASEEHCQRQREALQAGRHICDERGILLDEFKPQYETQK